jgi:hypothetical protein
MKLGRGAAEVTDDGLSIMKAYPFFGVGFLFSFLHTTMNHYSNDIIDIGCVRTKTGDAYSMQNLLSARGLH